MTKTLILHHKNVSPYSEKIRLMLGHSGLPWQSVQAPLTPPRPSIDPLVGGYRRIPVAQLGADIFCDTRLIADQIARLSDKPQLSPFSYSGPVQAQQEHIETTVFTAALAALPALGLFKALWQQIPLRQLGNYLKDKKHLIKHASTESSETRPTRKAAKQIWQRHLRTLNQQLDHNAFLTSDSPCYIDFCAYHMIWFRQGMDGDHCLKTTPRAKTWYRNMERFGHGNPKEITAKQALESARIEPQPIDPEFLSSPRIGAHLTIGTKDVSLGDTQGTLVGEDQHRWILSRITDCSGTVHIHLPKISCEIRNTSDHYY